MTLEEARGERATQLCDEFLQVLEAIGVHGEALPARHRRLVDCVEHMLAGGVEDGRCNAVVAELVAEKVPFVLFSYELACLRGAALKTAIDAGEVATIRAVQGAFDILEERCAGLYVDHYLPVLARRNHMRLAHIDALSDKNLLVHFEAHLRWMQALIAAVAGNKAADLPERDPTQCGFGRWLHSEGSLLIRDRSHRHEVAALHADLHGLLGELAASIGERRRNRHLYALLKRAELISLDLGNEIALINNIVIMSSYNKDPLTGLLSRRSLDKVLINQLEIARATELTFCVVMCDLDHFKVVNDTYGHLTGDEALRHFAELARARLRQSDLIFRHGGEEFLIVLPSSSREQGVGLAERMRADLAAAPLRHDGQEIALSASFGVVEVHPGSYPFIDAEVVRDILREADSRLYMAKNKGRNCVV